MIQLRKFSLKSYLSRIITAIIFLAVTDSIGAQRTPLPDFDSLLTNKTDTIPAAKKLFVDSILPNDTIPSLADDSLIAKRDTFSLKLSKDTLVAPVKYAAEDSVVIEIRKKKITLYGKTKTEYDDVVLTAPVVEIDQETQMLKAAHAKDSLGNVKEEAKFTQGGTEFTMDTVLYNFKNQKAITTNAITQMSEMFLHAEKGKKVSEDVTFMHRGFITTCNLDHPHFGFRTNKLKVVNKKLAVSGPTHPEFEGVPLPVYLPFGIFPLNREKRHSGLLPVEFNTNDQMGVGLDGFGYYYVLNDYWDIKAQGSIYSYGTWSGTISPTYRKRYKYAGSLNFTLQHTKRNFKGDPDFYSNNSYRLTWSHSADNRSRPGTTFSANVNASSTAFNRNVPNNVNLNFQNQMGSSITYSKTWVDKPYNLTLSANHNQNNQTGIVNVSLPDMGFTVSTLYPFQRKTIAGTKKWYEQLGVAYNGNFRNQVSFYDTAFKLRNLIDTLQWGAQHSIPVTLSLPPILGGAIMVSPSISYSQVWVSRAMTREWNSTTEKVENVYEKGLFVDQQASFGLSFSTALFGTFQFKNSNIKALRHVVRPSISANYSPNLSKKYQYTSQINAGGDRQTFSKLQGGGGLYSGYSGVENGGLSFQLDNNLEMKVRNRKDTTGENPDRKIRIIDGFGVSTSYNFLADSLKLAPFNFYFRSNLFEKINLSANAIMTPYENDHLGRNINKYKWEGGRLSLGRISSASISLSTSFQSKPKDEEKDKKRQDALNEQMNDPTLAAEKQQLMEYMRQNPAEFVDFNIPWQTSISFSLNYFSQFNADSLRFISNITSNLNFNGSFSLTPKWKFTANGFLNLNEGKLQTFTMSISREMHCWQMSINVTPIGYFRYFNISISPKSGLLQDLRINRTRSFFTGY